MLHWLIILALIPFALRGVGAVIDISAGLAMLLWRVLGRIIRFTFETFWLSREGRIILLAWAAVGLLTGAVRLGMVR